MIETSKTYQGMLSRLEFDSSPTAIHRPPTKAKASVSVGGLCVVHTGGRTYFAANRPGSGLLYSAKVQAYQIGYGMVPLGQWFALLFAAGAISSVDPSLAPVGGFVVLGATPIFMIRLMCRTFNLGAAPTPSKPPPFWEGHVEDGDRRVFEVAKKLVGRADELGVDRMAAAYAALFCAARDEDTDAVAAMSASLDAATPKTSFSPLEEFQAAIDAPMPEVRDVVRPQGR